MEIVCFVKPEINLASLFLLARFLWVFRSQNYPTCDWEWPRVTVSVSQAQRVAIRRWKDKNCNNIYWLNDLITFIWMYIQHYPKMSSSVSVHYFFWSTWLPHSFALLWVEVLSCPQIQNQRRKQQEEKKQQLSRQDRRRCVPSLWTWKPERDLYQTSIRFTASKFHESPNTWCLLLDIFSSAEKHWLKHPTPILFNSISLIPNYKMWLSKNKEFALLSLWCTIYILPHPPSKGW